MLRIKQFIFNPVCVNTYVVSDDSGEGVIIDCGCAEGREWQELDGYLKANNIKVVHLLNTHLHLDHVFGNQFAIPALGLKPEASAQDYPLYANLRSQVAMFFGERIADSLNYDYTRQLGPSLHDGDEVKFGNTILKVIATPGHTPGGLCFYDEADHILFSGDTLFQGSIGRTDLEGGNYATLIRSVVNRLKVLPDDTKVYSGHGGMTTIGYEKDYNPYL